MTTPMTTLNRIRNIFLLVGLALLAGTVWWAVSTRSFVARAEVAKGTVVALAPSRGSKGSRVYHPVVDYVLPGGQMIEIRSSSGSSPPAYSVGEKVEVLYLPDRPREGRIRGVFSLWGGPFILGGLGLIFSGIGGGMRLASLRKARRVADLRQHGTPVQAAFQAVELNTNLRVNGRHPFRIVTQWLNPATGKLHVFRSDNLWFDPNEFAKGRKITVFLDPSNPRRYAMDLSFLPEVAE
jgi:hypothetical protein